MVALLKCSKSYAFTPEALGGDTVAQRPERRSFSASRLMQPGGDGHAMVLGACLPAQLSSRNKDSVSASCPLQPRLKTRFTYRAFHVAALDVAPYYSRGVALRGYMACKRSGR